MIPVAGAWTRWTLALLAAAFVVVPPVSAQLVDDHSPWWLWADRWKGDFSYEEETHATDLVDASSKVNGTLVLDHKEIEGCTAKWVGKHGNKAKIDSQAVGGMDEQNDVARLHGTSTSSAKGSFPLSPRSGLSISMEKGAYKVSVAASASAKVKGSSGVTAGVDMSGYSQKTGWQDGGEVEVGFDQKGYAKVPENRGPLEDKVSEEQGASDASYRSEFRWSLTPEHDIEMWVYRYTGLLENQRKSFIDMHQSFLEANDCTGGLLDSTPCRAARSALEKTDRRIATLADDCRRVLEKLLKSECGGFARAMRATSRAWQYEHAVCTDPAMTCDVIHQHLYDFFDTGPTGDDTVTYGRLPSHLKCLYARDEFDEVATLGSTSWLSKALGD
jgi:hypothetical protein